MPSHVRAILKTFLIPAFLILCTVYVPWSAGVMIERVMGEEYMVTWQPMYGGNVTGQGDYVPNYWLTGVLSLGAVGVSATCIFIVLALLYEIYTWNMLSDEEKKAQKRKEKEEEDKEKGG